MENSPLVWLDLCSGLGGASQPALDRGWKVIRVDIDPRFKPDIVADVRALPLKPFHVDVLWASPPCQDFSKWGMRHFYPEPPAPDMSLAQGVRDFIERIQPRWWIVENVRSSRPFLTTLFGQVRANVPGHALWSNQILLLPNIKAHKQFMGHDAVANWTTKSGRLTRQNKNRRAAGPLSRNGPAEAAKIPYEIGEAVCRAVEAAPSAASVATVAK